MVTSDIGPTRSRSWRPVLAGVGGLFIAWVSLAFPLGGLVVVLYGVCCLVFSIRRWWQGEGRLGWAIITSLVVFVMTMAVSWQVLSLKDMEAPSHFLHRRLYEARLRETIKKYHCEKDVYPDSLSDLEIPTGMSELLKDSWSHPLYYVRTADGYRLKTLGRDGAPGGAGLDADRDLTGDDRSHEVRIPLRQFLFECYGASKVWAWPPWRRYLLGAFGPCVPYIKGMSHRGSI